MRRRRTVVALALASLLVGGCSSPTPGATSPSAGLEGARSMTDGRYALLVADLHHRGTGVWIESDFVKAYLDGPSRYHQVLEAALALARRPGVSGIKVADELGYHDGTDPEQALAVVRAAVRDIHTASPTTKVLIDVVVPELGCLSWTPTSTPAMRMCGANAQSSSPGASVGAVDGYVAAGVDVIDLSTGLQDDGWYDEQGTSRDEAMRQCWREAVRRWGTRVTLQARKALAHPGAYAGDAARAEADVHTYVDIPLAEGARAVDIWTWAQHYRGQLVTLADPGDVPNALTRALEQRRKKGAQLWTHMTPSAYVVDRGHDVRAVTSQFDVVFVAAGTG
ncbi:hypothetical protein [Terracoccus sp. 273MFTsu3.1]|uniref:hypothetical protein n=1 Tax=Terracoccus sp. 273MFTsu3.1 TaxID=1172188 RepID=UPI0018CA4551|nr:hypothetical protein [Terracoccus sp. 273MFTsu3.1]